MLTTIKTLLTEAEEQLRAHDIDTARLDAEILLASVLATDRTHLFSRLSSSVAQSDQAAFQLLLQRRLRREPLAYITGVREFWSLEFRVTPDVLIPRPETELVIETALRLAAQSTIYAPQSPIPNPQSPLCMLDVGTGSGCIAIALAKELPTAELWAVDISQTALAVARVNAQRHGVEQRIQFQQGDLFSPVRANGQYFDLIVSNPPYITRFDCAALQPEVCEWEPQTALDGGEDGLDFYRRLVAESPTYLRPGGWLIMELGAGQSPQVLHLIQARGNFQASYSVQDYAGIERVVVAHSCI